MTEKEKGAIADIEVAKHSKNIIDLIEVGDFVNNWKVLEIADSIYENSKRVLIYRSKKEKYERWIYIQEYNRKIHTQDDIVSIVTKEQFASIEYKI
jgi:ubiquinone/menaquinone biosynthesis C-methylase UbiE